MNHVTENLDTEPWYKQGWPWALIAIPLLTVIAGVITFMIAINTSDSLVQDDYYKKGLAINHNIDRQLLADSLSLVAFVNIQPKAKLLTLALDTSLRNELPSELLLKFSHPTLQEKDVFFHLTPLTNNEYVAEFSNLDPAYWHVSLEDNSKSWLMKTRWLYPSNTPLVIRSKRN